MKPIVTAISKLSLTKGRPERPSMRRKWKVESGDFDFEAKERIHQKALNGGKREQ